MKHLLTSLSIIFVGFMTLNMFPVFIGGGLIIFGIIMLIVRKWPEQ